MSQSLCNMLVHVIFSTQDRQNLIDGTIELELYQYITQVCKTHKSPLRQIGGIENHVHLLISLSRSITLAKLVAEIKAHTSRWIKTKGESYANFAWQSGYGAFSIGQSNFLPCINYIKNQKNHHKHKTFQEELKEILMKYKIDYDEKYLWN